MIGVIFSFINETVEVRIDNSNCLFRTQQFGGALTPIENLRIDKNGALKEFPDLKDNPEWKQITIERFKEKMKGLKTEQERVNYVINDLKKYGYVPLYIQRAGHRPVKITQ